MCVCVCVCIKDVNVSTFWRSQFVFVNVDFIFYWVMPTVYNQRAENLLDEFSTFPPSHLQHGTNKRCYRKSYVTILLYFSLCYTTVSSWPWRYMFNNNQNCKTVKIILRWRKVGDKKKKFFAMNVGNEQSFSDEIFSFYLLLSLFYLPPPLLSSFFLFLLF